MQNSSYNLTKEKAIRSLEKDVLRKYPPRKGFSEKPAAGKSDKDEESEGKRKTINVPLETLKLAAKLAKTVGKTTLTVTEESAQVTIQAGKIAPMAVMSLVTLGSYRTKKGDLKGAIQAYQEAIKVDKKNSGLYLLLGEAYLQDGNPRLAEKHLRKSLELDNSIPHTHKVLSEVYYKRKRTEEADKESQIYEQLLLKSAQTASSPVTVTPQP